MHRSIRLLLVIVLGACAQQQAPRFLNDAILVRISVVAQDGSGEPVRGLTQDDFAVTDGGSTKQLAFFAAHDSESPAATGARPATVLSNRSDAAGDPVSATVILFDALNTKFEKEADAKRQLLNSLKSVPPGARVALYSLGKDLRVIHDFTGDPAALIQAAGKYAAVSALPKGAGAEEARRRSRLLERDTDAATRDWLASDTVTNQYEQADAPETTLTALETIAHHLAYVPGRKQLIWVSEAFPIAFGFAQAKAPPASRDPDREFRDRALRTCRLLDYAGVAIYPLQARALMAGSRRRVRPAREGKDAGPFAIPVRAAMDTLANETGGRAFDEKANPAAAIKRALGDSRFTYALGYYVPRAEWDGRYRPVQVSVKKPVAALRHRRGYVAAEPAMSAEDRDAAFRAAAESPLQSSTIGLRAVVPRNPLDVGEQQVGVIINARDIRFVEREGRQDALVRVVWLEYAADGTQVWGVEDKLELALKPETYGLVQRDDIRLRKQLNIAFRVVRLRVLVRDGAGCGIGSLDIPARQPGG